MIEHSKGLKKIINEFEDDHALTDIQEEYIDDNDGILSLPTNITQGDIYGSDPTEEKIDTSEEKKAKGEAVFHAAS